MKKRRLEIISPVFYITTIALAIFTGCRWSEFFIDRTPRGTVYDTAYEELLNSPNASPLTEVWREDVPVYAEPVAICGWNEGISTWHIHFATNREILPGDFSRTRYGNGVANHPGYGSSLVTIPRRRRGIDIPLEQNGKKIDLSGESVTDVIENVQSLSPEEFLRGVNRQLKASRQNDLLLFVHGFNVSFDSSLVRTAQIALDMPFNGAVVSYSWPSQGGLQNYGRDEPINKRSVEPFREFLNELRAGVSPETRIHIMVHSMGNRIVLEALSALEHHALTGDEALAEAGFKPPIAHLVLMAPDVGVSDFTQWFPQVARNCEHVTLYASSNDAALIVSKSLHAEMRAGDADPPIILDGLETIDCTDIDVTSFLGHSYYSSNVDVLSDVFVLIKRGRPAEKRPYLKAQKTRAGTYWAWTGNAPRDFWTWHFDHLDSPIQSVSGERDAVLR